MDVKRKERCKAKLIFKNLQNLQGLTKYAKENHLTLNGYEMMPTESNSLLYIPIQVTFQKLMQKLNGFPIKKLLSNAFSIIIDPPDYPKSGTGVETYYCIYLFRKNLKGGLE